MTMLIRRLLLNDDVDIDNDGVDDVFFYYLSIPPPPKYLGLSATDRSSARTWDLQPSQPMPARLLAHRKGCAND